MNERLKKITEKMQQGQPVVGIFVLPIMSSENR